MPVAVDCSCEAALATVSSAPVRTNTNVTSVTRTDGGYLVATTDGDIRCRCVVLANGACNLTRIEER